MASLLAIFISGCSLGQTFSETSHIEVIDFRIMLFKEGDNKFKDPEAIHSHKIWYKDSIAIEEITSLSIHEDGDGVTTVSNIILFYRYSDLKTRNIYEYSSFNDTAAISANYSMDDTTMIVGGWNFMFDRKFNDKATYEIISDTAIHNVNYKRAKVLRGTKKIPYVMTYYSRCDKKATVFNQNIFVSKITKCPVVKMQTYYPLKNGVSTISEVNFLADTLTEKEQKVFDAWQRNEIENPVKRKNEFP